MADVSSSSKTAYADLDWSQYSQYRPPYPPSLKSLIYSYRDQHSDASRGILVDIGGGVGISSVPYLADFETTHLLDPSPSNHEKAHVFLDEYVRSRGLQTGLAFTVAKAEDRHEHIRNVSLAICATAAHYIDPDGLITSAAAMLRPGGTIAIYTYWGPAFPDQSPALGAAFARAATTAMRLCIRPGDEGKDTRSLLEKVTARLTAGQNILDFIAVPSDLFEAVIRIRINPEAEIVFETYRSNPPVPCQPLASQLTKAESKISYTSGSDPEAEGWSFSVDIEWLHGMIRSILPASIQLTEEQHESLYDDLDRIFAAECPSGTARALFAVNVVLATRKRGAPTQP